MAATSLFSTVSLSSSIPNAITNSKISNPSNGSSQLVPATFNSSSSSSKHKSLRFPFPLNASAASSSPCAWHFVSLSKSTTARTSLASNSSAAPNQLRSSFARHVALASDYEQEQQQEEDGNEEQRFSPELKLFVGNLPFGVDSARLADLFGQAGTVEMVEVIYDKMTGRSRGFGFVTMSTFDEVQAASMQFNGYDLDGRSLRVNSGPRPPKDENAPRVSRGGSSADSENRVYVGNLSWGVDDLALQTLFSEQGRVLDAKVVYDRESGRSKGFGFVTFSSEEEVNNAVNSLNGVDLKGRAIRVVMAEARPKRFF